MARSDTVGQTGAPSGLRMLETLVDSALGAVAEPVVEPGPILLTTEVVAKMIGVDPSTLRRWRTSRPIQGPPFIKISDRVTKYHPQDVEKWLDRCRVTPEVAA